MDATAERRRSVRWNRRDTLNVIVTEGSWRVSCHQRHFSFETRPHPYFPPFPHWSSLE